MWPAEAFYLARTEQTYVISFPLEDKNRKILARPPFFELGTPDLN